MLWIHGQLGEDPGCGLGYTPSCLTKGSQLRSRFGPRAPPLQEQNSLGSSDTALSSTGRRQLCSQKNANILVK